jgi:acyl CoA:acetate/3-ketoacid CoA transferase beta subunit
VSEPATLADICVTACAEAWRGDGEVMASPFGTIPSLGARLARLTFEPDLVLTDGEAALMANTPAVSGGTRGGGGAGGGGSPAGGGPGGEPEAPVLEAWMPYRRVFDTLWSGRRHIMMMASQVDRYGNQNLSAIGDWERPKAQLIGVRGAPGNTINHRTSYWVPSHSKRSFVEHVDFVCGVGYDRAEIVGPAARFHEVRYVISNLGVFEFPSPDRAMRIRSVHPGVKVEEIEEATGFALVSDPEVPTTRSPTAEELEIINSLDPARTRDGEVASK